MAQLFRAEYFASSLEYDEFNSSFSVILVRRRNVINDDVINSDNNIGGVGDDNFLFYYLLLIIIIILSLSLLSLLFHNINIKILFVGNDEERMGYDDDFQNIIRETTSRQYLRLYSFMI